MITSCGHVFCSTCLSKKFSTDTGIPCPNCQNSITSHNVFNTSSNFKALLLNLKLKCLVCTIECEYQHIDRHVCAIPGTSSIVQNEITTLAPEVTDLKASEILAKPSMGEQGGESIHRVFNRINNNVKNIRDPLVRLNAVM